MPPATTISGLITYVTMAFKNKESQATPLLGAGGLGPTNLDGTRLTDLTEVQLWRNFLVMCIAFSFNHGCVVSCLAYSSTELGADLGGYGSGCLYVFYALTAFFLSKPVVSMVGPRLGLFMGTAGYCVYVAGFLFAVLVPRLAWPVFLVSASVGGVAGGLLWTAQGRYFARNAKLYSEATGDAVENVSGIGLRVGFANPNPNPNRLCIPQITCIVRSH